MLANISFAIGVCSGFARGGIRGVTEWIEHITYEGTIRTREVSPGVIQFTVPVVKHVYLWFVSDWIFLIALTVGCFYLRKSCARKIGALEARRNKGL
jgi:hypothetical protein